jgi:hypothetical protein
MTESSGARMYEDGYLPLNKVKTVGYLLVIDLVYYLDFKKMVS